MLGLESIGAGLRRLRRRQLAGEGLPVVEVAVDRRHPVVVGDLVVTLIERVTLVGGQLLPELVELLGIVGHRPRQHITRVRVGIRVLGGVIARRGDRLGQAVVSLFGLREQLRHPIDQRGLLRGGIGVFRFRLVGRGHRAGGRVDAEALAAGVLLDAVQGLFDAVDVVGAGAGG